MSILIAVVENKQAEAKNLADLLAQAIDNGDIAETDRYTKDLLLLANQESSLELPIAAWQQFIEIVRKIKPGFISSYLLDKEDIDIIMAAKLPDNCISIKALAEIAKSKNARLLQLPIDMVS